MTAQSKLVTAGSDFELGKENAISLQTCESIYKTHMHTLAILEKYFLIERVEKRKGEQEFWLFEPLPKVINALREMKNTNLIEFPDDEQSIEGFIKKYLRSKVGKPLGNNLRQFRYIQKLKMTPQSA